jgi:hypothetical protein
VKRRSFLQTAGVVVTGGVAAAGSAVENTQRETTRHTDATDTREVLITSADSNLCRAITERLSDSWRVHLTGAAATDTKFPFTKSELGHDQDMGTLVKGVQAIVHVGLPPPGATGTQVIDFRTRATYNLLRSAAQQGVQSVVYLSSLGIMLGYDKRLMITEDFRPRPTPKPEALSHHLGEFTCREFARPGKLDVVVFRLGRVDGIPTEEPFSDELPLTKPQDVASAVASAIGYRSGLNGPDPGPWNVIHIHSEVESSRFPLTKAERLLRYQPQSTGADS